METPINPIKWAFIWLTFVGICVLLLIGIVAGISKGRIWLKEQSGRAALAEAIYSKQVKTEEAKANLESEKLNALAEVERAKGAAEAIRIEGGQLTDNYIKYLWVRQLATGDKQLIYVPTEAGLPLLEAGRGR